MQERLDYKSPKQPRSNSILPVRDREAHSSFLLGKLNEAWGNAENETAVYHTTRDGVYLEFKGSPGYELVTKSLEDMRSKKVRLCNIRIENETVKSEDANTTEEKPVTYATVYVANEKKDYFFGKILKYATENSPGYLFSTSSFPKKCRQLFKVRESNLLKFPSYLLEVLPAIVGIALYFPFPGNPKNHEMIESISDIQKALLIESFWMDDSDLIPCEEPEWCEVWLRGDKDNVLPKFEELLGRSKITAKQGTIDFPERVVKLVCVNREQLEKLTIYSDHIAEYRKAKDTEAFWLDIPTCEQAGWVENLLERLQVDRESLISVCIFDTGVNYGHPLLTPVLDAVDCHTYNSEWGRHDHNGHGTLMAGLAAYGNLANHLAGTAAVIINHVLESVKILQIGKGNANKQELWGYITAQGVSRAEIQAPYRKRIHCMAVTSTDTRDRGRPSSWSGALDQVTSGTDDGQKRLMIVSAGNADLSLAANYPNSQVTDSVHDPAQSWNALTVGAYTQLSIITDPTLKGFSPLAKVNELSPFSTTSSTWEDKWPIKPEIVMEGGNLADNGNGTIIECDDLSLLSTFYKPIMRQFNNFNMTSAATAQTANFAAQIQVRYPDYWPETIRALMVHSAEWSDELKKQFMANGLKTEIKRLLRICGYGVPNLEKALHSASNSLTLIAQAEIQPFKQESGQGKTCDMHFTICPGPRKF